VTNLILSGIFDRHPDLKTVSVESGCGWIPFILETLDYEMAENAPDEHPTCLYANPLQAVEEKMATLSPEARRKILGENARKLYRL
jgi:uncharacterized protein